MLSFLPKTPQDVMQELKEKYKTRRKQLKLSQQELSTRADVSLGSLKRFETTGKISLESLLKLAFVLECLEDFSGVCEMRNVLPQNLEEVFNEL
jgi:transcriptional regulator with XRE-family HTH domain